MQYSFLPAADPAVAAALQGEETRQKEGLELVASENYVSPAVMETMGSVFNNKYSEGYPGRRYYAGQQFTDEVENLARDRACQLFDCAHANVQPLTGAVANVAAYFSILEPGDTILGMRLDHGGHLTHGHPVTHLAKMFRFVRYGMKDIDTGEIDYDELRHTALKEKPKLILAGFSAYPRSLDFARMKEIADEVGAYTMADMAHIAGLIAGKAVRNPFHDGFDLITSTTHKTLRGPRGGIILSRTEELGKKVDKSVFPGLQGGPIMQMVAAKAVAFGEALTPDFEAYAAQIIKNAKAMEEAFAKAGVAMTTGGTDNHLLLINARKSFDISGAELDDAMDAAGLSANKNMLPDDTGTPMQPDGVRLGTPAITTRGFTEKECTRVAELIVDIGKNAGNEQRISDIQKEVKDLALAFPVPGIA